MSKWLNNEYVASAALFVVLGYTYISFSMGYSLYKYSLVKSNLGVASGVVEGRKGDSRGIRYTSTSIKIKYAFDYKGERYYSDVYDVLGRYEISALKMPSIGDPIVVYFNKDDPNLSTIRLDDNVAESIMRRLLLYFALLIISTVYLVNYAVRGRSRPLPGTAQRDGFDPAR